METKGEGKLAKQSRTQTIPEVRDGLERELMGNDANENVASH